MIVYQRVISNLIEKYRTPNRKVIFQQSIFRCYVSLPEGNVFDMFFTINQSLWLIGLLAWFWLLVGRRVRFWLGLWVGFGSLFLTASHSFLWVWIGNATCGGSNCCWFKSVPNYSWSGRSLEFVLGRVSFMSSCERDSFESAVCWCWELDVTVDIGTWSSTLVQKPSELNKIVRVLWVMILHQQGFTLSPIIMEVEIGPLAD